MTLLRIQPDTAPESTDGLYPAMAGGDFALDAGETAAVRLMGETSAHRGPDKLWEIKQMAVCITEHRLMYATNQIAKGSIWLGTPALALALTGVSHLLAAAKRHGKVVAGQLRWPYLDRVASTTMTTVYKNGRRSPTYMLRFECHDAAGEIGVWVPGYEHNEELVRWIAACAMGPRGEQAPEPTLTEDEQAGFGTELEIRRLKCELPGARLLPVEQD